VTGRPITDRRLAVVRSLSIRTPTLAALLAAAATSAAPASAAAQGGGGPIATQCQSAQFYVQDACQKAIDMFNLLAPQLGTSLAGGNAVLGQSGTLGGFGRFTLGLRANALRGTIPRSTGVALSVTAAQRTNFQTETQVLGLPTADAAIGLFRGVPMGLTNVGGLDAIVSLSYIPDIDVNEVSVSTTGGSVKVGYGARLGILEETAAVPGVSVTYLRRALPQVSVVTRTATDTIAVNDIDAEASSWRLVVGKRFWAIGLTGGLGQDRYDASASAGAVINRVIPGLASARVAEGRVAAATQDISRTNYFGDVTLFLPFARIIAEVGRTSGGDVPAPYNAFGGKTGAEAYTYGALGLRVEF
jgi:hypothetical protein